jgi:hypothetical protein
LGKNEDVRGTKQKMLRDTVPGCPQFDYENGIIFIYDTERDKWLSVSRESVAFGIKNKNIMNDRWMCMAGDVQSISSGYRLYRDLTITAISFQNKEMANCVIELKCDGLTLYTLTLNSQTGKAVDNLDINLDGSDCLHVFLKIISGTVSFPELMVEISWRKL